MRINTNKEGKKRIGSDEELVKIFLKTRQSFCFEELYRRHYSRVFRQCFFILKDSAKAEDFTHDIFLKLLSRLHLFKFEARFTTWLFRITSNHCFEYLRLVKKRQEYLLDTGFEVADDVDIHRVFEGEDADLKNLEIAMEYLSLDEKGLLFMKYYDDLSVADIAEVFKISESAIKMRLMRLREKLRYFMLKKLPD